uniref:Uncharacterized protein n=1 Tax=Rhizophora mucronata TaxID=61149 RepID=A0A2P2P4N9_RHIMU
MLDSKWLLWDVILTLTFKIKLVDVIVGRYICSLY